MSLGFPILISLIALLILASVSQTLTTFTRSSQFHKFAMDASDIPDPPAHFTPQQVRAYYLKFVKQTLSLSTTKDGSHAQHEKDAQHEVNQPMPSTMETELPMVVHTGTEVDPAKHVEVADDPTPPAPAAEKPSSSKSDPKEQIGRAHV